MSTFVWRLLVAMVLVSTTSGLVSAAPEKPPAKKPKADEVCVERIHIIKGCSVCEVMMGWLTQGGIKLNIKKVDRGPYPTYPVVLYSDGTRDHGDRMYSRNAGIPEKIEVVSCESAGG